MNIYLAARFRDRKRLRPVRDKLWGMGHEVVSSWIDEVRKPEFLTTEEWHRKLAIKDLTEIRAADLLIIDTLGKLVVGGGGGREFEFGFAYGQFHKKLIFLVGKRNHAFHALVDEQFPSWTTALRYIEICRRYYV